ncbi:prepilin peptidase [Afifella sp. H1R]|uniref:A24 family peptidase n=1 Tax=Afifella sp. H1R TaxID=2908841 RepID=UPI001F33B955|nr:prepilin peptidase [Afifella sp. H1R]
MSAIALLKYAVLFLFPLLMTYAGIMDLLTFKIRNVLVLFLLILWLIAAPLAGLTLHEMGLSLAVGLATFCVTFAFFAAGWIGGGDAKLASVAALWFGWADVLPYFALASVLGGVLTLVVLQLRMGRIPFPNYWPDCLSRFRDGESGVPYGVAFAAAALILFHQTDWLPRLT